MKFQQLLEDIKQYVLNYFDTHHDPELVYHNVKHTKEVVAHATRIANHYQLNDEDFFVVVTAAWFHDLGYFTDKINHEAVGVAIAVDFLKPLGVDESILKKIDGCITGTKMPQNPTGLLQQIVCDADLFHLGTDDFADKSKLLRKEIEAVKHIDLDKKLWREKNIELMEAHTYFTDYAQLLLGDKQNKNLKKLKSKDDDEKEKPSETFVMPTETPLKKSAPTQHVFEQSDKNKKAEKPEKGIETMFRITSGNNQRLSDMADKKAHILITVNSIILSAIISLVLKKLDENGFLAIPSFLLLTVSLLSMIFSILATRPSIPKGTFTQADVDDKTVNLLFFGNFYKMGLEEYANGMKMVMNDIDFLYGTLIKDVYSQGVVLGRKYRLLRVAYNIFMFGLIIAVLAFIVSSIIHDRTTVAAH